MYTRESDSKLNVIANSPSDNSIVDKTPYVKPKRKRLTESQTLALSDAFEISTKPSAKTRIKLALELGLTARAVQIWFQNRRARQKMLAELAKKEEETFKEIVSQLAEAECAPTLTTLQDEFASYFLFDQQPGQYVDLGQYVASESMPHTNNAFNVQLEKFLESNIDDSKISTELEESLSAHPSAPESPNMLETPQIHATEYKNFDEQTKEFDALVWQPFETEFVNELFFLSSAYL